MTKKKIGSLSLLVCSAILIGASAISVALTSQVSAQKEQTCKWGIFHVVKINGKEQVLCNPPPFIEKFKPFIDPNCPECGKLAVLNCPSCPVIILFNPEEIQRLGLEDLVTIHEGKDFDNVTVRVPHDQGILGNNSIGPGIGKAP